MGGIVSGAGMGSLGGPVGATIGAGVGAVGTIADFIKKIFGRRPKSNIEHFQLDAYPSMSQQASATGIPVDCYWFLGEIIRVMPDGRFAVVADRGTLDAAWQYWRELERANSFYILKCQDTMVACVFELRGQGNPIAIIPGWEGAGGAVAQAGLAPASWMWLIGGLAVAVVVYFAFTPKR